MYKFCLGDKVRLTRKQVLQLAAEASVDPRTIESVYAGARSKPMVRERIETAAKKLKFPGLPKEESAA